MSAEDRERESAAMKVVHTVLKNFEACGVIVKTDDVQLGMAIADAAQSIERFVKTESD